MKKLNSSPAGILVLLVLITFCTSGLFAQKSIMKFGKIPMEDMKMTVYAKDTNASAVILGEEGFSEYIYTEDDGWQLKTKIHRRIKILNQRGLKYADQEVSLYKSGSNKEDFSSLKGFTYNLVNGKIEKEKISGDAKFSEEVDDFHTSQKFTFPNVKPGSILEYSYVVTSDFLTPDFWYFQYEIPVVESQYTIEIPEFLTFKEQSKGYEFYQRTSNEISRKFTYSYAPQIESGVGGGRSSGGIAEVEIRVTIKNYHAYAIPAFISEPYMNSIRNYLTCIEYELMSFTPKYGIHKNFSNTWESVRNTLMEHEKFGLQLKGTGFLNDDANKITTGSTSDLNKAMQVFDFIKSKMTWNKIARLYVKDNIRSAYKDAIGNSAEINLLLVALLRKVGLEANPVILSTRSNGIIMPGQIMLNKFNYVIAGVKLFNRTVLLDATDKNCPFNMLPERCLNGEGRIVSETFIDLVDLNTAQTYETFFYAQAELSADGQLKAKVSELYKGYAAYESRDKISNESTLDDYRSKFEQSKKGIEVSEFEILDKDSIQKPLNLKYDADLSRQITAAGDMLYFNPMIFGRKENNPFKLENRKYPVDYIYPISNKFIINFTIPENLTVVEMPKSISYSLPDKTITFKYLIIQKGSEINLLCDFNINKPIFAYNEYPALKQLYENIVAKQAEQIVLKKIN